MERWSWITNELIHCRVHPACPDAQACHASVMAPTAGAWVYALLAAD